MGADLIGGMWFGPDKLDESKKEAAKQQCREVIACIKAITDAELPDDSVELIKAGAALKALGIDTDNMIELGIREEDDPDVVVDELYEFWNELRDSQAFCRHLPGDKNRIVVCYGEWSWGDAPDCMAYRCLINAEYYGLTYMLGIE